MSGTIDLGATVDQTGVTNRPAVNVGPLGVYGHVQFSGGTLSNWQIASSTCAVLQDGTGAVAIISGNTYICSNLYWDGANWRYIANGAGSLVGSVSGTMSVYIAPSGTAGNVATITALAPCSNLGLFSAISLFAPGSSQFGAAGQGAYIGWNNTGGTGEMDFVCHKGGGGGAFYFYITNNATAGTLVATIDGNGQFKGANYGSALIDKGVVPGTVAIDLTKGDHQAFQTTSATPCTVSWTLPSNPCRFSIRVKAPAAGTSSAVTWPAMKGVAPTAFTLNKESLLQFDYDGTDVFYTGGVLNV